MHTTHIILLVIYYIHAARYDVAMKRFSFSGDFATEAENLISHAKFIIKMSKA